MTDQARTFRGGARPHLVFALCYGTWKPDRMGGLVPQSWRFSPVDLYRLEHLGLDDVDVIMIPGNHDQLFLKSIEPRLVAYLAAGGHFLINGHLTLPWLPWLPCLSPYQPVNPRPFTNWMIRPAEPGAYFGRMDFET